MGSDRPRSPAGSARARLRSRCEHPAQPRPGRSVGLRRGAGLEGWDWRAGTGAPAVLPGPASSPQLPRAAGRARGQLLVLPKPVPGAGTGTGAGVSSHRSRPGHSERGTGTAGSRLGTCRPRGDVPGPAPGTLLPGPGPLCPAAASSGERGGAAPHAAAVPVPIVGRRSSHRPPWWHRR